MTDRQRLRRLALIARRARHIERPPDLDPEAVEDLTTAAKASEQAGALWIARARGQFDRERQIIRVRKG